jgi:hypothetical protein
MFPVIYSSTTDFFILAPSYDPLIEPYAREPGALGKAGAGCRPGRSAPEYRADFRMPCALRGVLEQTLSASARQDSSPQLAHCGRAGPGRP